ncbi:protein of unknown function [Agrobacterium pusense]|uniref:Uncharacterized protein n=1 Tax=Agrobacterium pusense TaxID=648995 RepID=U4PVK8_9HYPH|nr:protein of unknown function [Agrobacterium pusense]
MRSYRSSHSSSHPSSHRAACHNHGVIIVPEVAPRSYLPYIAANFPIRTLKNPMWSIRYNGTSIHLSHGWAEQVLWREEGFGECASLLLP